MVKRNLNDYESDFELKRGLYLCFNTITFLLMLAINYLSESMPIGGMTNAEVSDLHPTLFTPIGLTFAIWGVIYVLLAIFTVRQYMNGQYATLMGLKWAYALSSLLNIAWIFAWHYDRLIISFILIAALFLTLSAITRRIKNADTLTRAAFGIYYGWITVATIANLFVVFESIMPWYSMSIWDEILTVIAVLTAGYMAVMAIKDRNDLFYAAAIIWALCGVIANHFLMYEATMLPIVIAAGISIAVVLYESLISFTHKIN